MKISTKNPADMTGGQLEAELDKLGKESSKIADEFISSGRGHEKYQETMQKYDPLAQKFKIVHERQNALYFEIQKRRTYSGTLRKIKKNPLKPGKSRKVIGANIRKMEREGYPPRQAVAASLRKAGVKRKANPEKKKTREIKTVRRPIAFAVQHAKAASGPWKTQAVFNAKDTAMDYARALHKSHPSVFVRVADE